MATELEYEGGMEQYFITSAQELNLRDSQNYVEIITMDEKFSEKITRLLSIYYFKKATSTRHKQSALAMKSSLNGVVYKKASSKKQLVEMMQAYDVIYSKNEILEALIFKFLLKYRNIPPVIFGCHTTLTYPKARSLHARLHNFLYGSFIYKFLANGVNSFHVINPADRDSASKLFPTHNIFYITNPFDFKAFGSEALRKRKEFDSRATKTRILWVGRITAQKGIDTLVDLVGRINQGQLSNRVEWTIVGTGDQEYKTLPLKASWQNVQLLGHVDHSEMHKIYTDADILISTSEWESLGYNLLEAMACGVTCLAFNITGPKDIITNGKNGYLANTTEEISDILSKFIEGKLPRLFDQSSLYKFEPERIYGKFSAMLFEASNARTKVAK